MHGIGRARAPAGDYFGDRGNGLSTKTLPYTGCAHRLCLRPTYRNKQTASAVLRCHAVACPCACPPIHPSVHAVVGIQQCNGSTCLWEHWLVGWLRGMSSVFRSPKRNMCDDGAFECGPFGGWGRVGYYSSHSRSLHPSIHPSVELDSESVQHRAADVQHNTTALWHGGSGAKLATSWQFL